MAPLFILYGSATGNAEHIAKDLRDRFVKRLEQQEQQQSSPGSVGGKGVSGTFDSVICVEGNDFKKKCLPIWESPPADGNTTNAAKKHGILVITSTTGNADPPENISRFIRYLKRRTTSPQTFSNCSYAVLGLGDTNYDSFCATAKLVDRKIGELGGSRVKKLVCADEGTGTMEEVIDPWLDSILGVMELECSGSGSGVGDDIGDDGNDDAADNGKKEPAKEKDGKVAAEATDIDDATSGAGPNPSGNAAAPTATAATGTTVAEIENEEKKADTESATTATNGGTTTPESGILSAIRTLLTLPPSDGAIPMVSDSTLPPIGPSLSSCQLVPPSQDADTGTGTDTTGGDVADIDGILADQHLDEVMTISTASTTAGRYYTFDRPFDSWVVGARYLTGTFAYDDVGGGGGDGG
mmetsp:Transcript_35127/g.76151  ORF Transcript_35127/g.76151 Transcript_35127/m.76151 type:complete len:411 (+) Transcript_35127:48-1280(+)